MRLLAGVASPLAHPGAIWAAALMLEHLGHAEAAVHIVAAIYGTTACGLAVDNVMLDPSQDGNLARAASAMSGHRKLCRNSELGSSTGTARSGADIVKPTRA